MCLASGLAPAGSASEHQLEHLILGWRGSKAVKKNRASNSLGQVVKRGRRGQLRKSDVTLKSFHPGPPVSQLSAVLLICQRLLVLETLKRMTLYPPQIFFLSPLADSDEENFVVLLKAKKLNSDELLGVDNYANQDILSSQKSQNREYTLYLFSSKDALL